jgi:DNA-binding NtrC family response regulator
VKTQIAVLIVEDEALVRFHLAVTLQEEGFKTFEAKGAKEAIAVLEANNEIRVVFTDIQMPGTMDGLALSHYIRKRWPPTYIVISSGRRSPTEEEMPHGAVFVEKPYAPHVMTKVLHDIRQQLA